MRTTQVQFPPGVHLKSEFKNKNITSTKAHVSAYKKGTRTAGGVLVYYSQLSPQLQTFGVVARTLIKPL